METNANSGGHCQRCRHPCSHGSSSSNYGFHPLNLSALMSGYGNNSGGSGSGNGGSLERCKCSHEEDTTSGGGNSNSNQPSASSSASQHHYLCPFEPRNCRRSFLSRSYSKLSINNPAAGTAMVSSLGLMHPQANNNNNHNNSNVFSTTGSSNSSNSNHFNCNSGNVSNVASTSNSSSGSTNTGVVTTTKSNSTASYFNCTPAPINLERNMYPVTHQWTKMLECAEFVGAKRSKHTVVAYRDAMYVFGGDNGKNMLNDLIRFGVKDKSWGRACATGTPPAPRYHHSAVVHQNSMFIFGGYTGDIHSNSNLTNRNDLFEYEFQRAMWVEWRFSGRMPVPRSAHGAAVYDDKMWIFAGYDGNARLNDMWTLNLTGDTHQWEEVEQKGDLPPTCCNFPVAVARDCMYVFSGQSGMQITNFLFEFNFQTKTWRRIGNEHVLRGPGSQPPSRRYGHTMVHHDRFLYVFGGSADSTLPNDLHCYDLDAQVWYIIQPEDNSDVPSGRVFHASAVIGDAMYIFGGTVDNSVRRGDTYRFQFSSYPRCTLRDDFGGFFQEKQLCDIQFIVGPSEVKIMAHIAFVAARSNYLRTKILAARELFQQQMHHVFGDLMDNNQVKSKQQQQHQQHQQQQQQQIQIQQKPAAAATTQSMLEIRLPNANPEAFEIILNYIYTDRIDLKDSYAGNLIILISDIYQLAGLFQMPRLAQGCIQYLEFKISKKNVLDGLYNAEHKKIQIVKDHCLQFIIKEENFNDIIMSNEFSDLDKSLLVEIIRKRLNPSKIVIETSMEKNVGTTLESDMAVFLETTGKEFCDINLMLDGKVIPAHKSVLSARTQYFQSMFRSFMPPDNNTNVTIGDILPSPESFQSLLRYIYYGETKLPPQDALYLFQAPAYFGLSNNRLHAFCKYSLEHNINYENVLQTLEAADYTKVEHIKEHALLLIVRDFPKVARLPKINELSRELLLNIIEAVADYHSKIGTRICINTYT